MNTEFSQNIGTKIVRDDWTRADSRLESPPTTNTIPFGEYVPDSSELYVFENSRSGMGPAQPIRGYSHDINQGLKLLTLFTPPLSEADRIYGRFGIGSDQQRRTNWFRIVVRDHTQGEETFHAFVRDTGSGITLTGEAYNLDEEELVKRFNGIQLPRAIAQIYIQNFHGTINLNREANVYT